MQETDRKLQDLSNSQLGKDILYCLKRWKKLTAFLRVEGAPLTNDETEHAIKDIVRHRKNSLFYKTKHGAHVGDVIMSVMQTAKHSDVNLFHYLVDLQMRRREVFDNPRDFLPWIWKEKQKS